MLKCIFKWLALCLIALVSMDSGRAAGQTLTFSATVEGGDSGSPDSGGGGGGGGVGGGSSGGGSGSGSGGTGSSNGGSGSSGGGATSAPEINPASAPAALALLAGTLLLLSRRIRTEKTLAGEGH